MKSSIEYLPPEKQQEILLVIQIIKEVVKPEMIILFGSYARNSYVEHLYTTKDGARLEYISDYDFLVITKNSSEKSYLKESQVTDLTNRIKPAVNLEIHEIAYINRGLELGEYFFVDIVSEGVKLYDTNAVKLSTPKILNEIELKEKIQRYFDTWLPQANEFLIDGKNALDRGSYKKAIFELHQAAECLYNLTLLVFTHYKPKTHNLWKLRRKAKPLSLDLYLLFPVESDHKERELFELLKQGYIDARYRDDYKINAAETELIYFRVSDMFRLVKDICERHIANL